MELPTSLVLSLMFHSFKFGFQAMRTSLVALAKQICNANSDKPESVVLMSVKVKSSK